MRYRRWDLVIYRVLILMGLTIFVAGDVLMVLVLLRDDRLFLSTAISVLIAIIGYAPARRFVEHFIDHYIYNFRFNLRQLCSTHNPPAVNHGLLSGKTLGGCKLLDLIGVGSVSEVYKAVDDDEIVAVKVLRASDNIKQRRFEREARIGMNLHCPNIAHVHEYVTTGRLHYMVVEYVDGIDLGTLLKRRETFPHLHILRWMDDICRALDFAHAEGIIHGDIKPSNIIIWHENSAVLTDFGVSDVAYDGDDIGTIHYMAPEQIRNNAPIDHRVDIYALSVVVYELLTLQRPFQGKPAQVLFAHLNDPAPDPRTTNPNINDNVASAVIRGLSKNEAERFNSAGEFALALQGYLPQPDSN